MFLKLIPCKPSPTPLLSSMARLLQMVVYSLWVHFLSQSPTWPPLSNPLRAPVESLLTNPALCSQPSSCSLCLSGKSFWKVFLYLVFSPLSSYPDALPQILWLVPLYQVNLECPELGFRSLLPSLYTHSLWGIITPNHWGQGNSLSPAQASPKSGRFIANCLLDICLRIKHPLILATSKQNPGADMGFLLRMNGTWSQTIFETSLASISHSTVNPPFKFQIMSKIQLFFFFFFFFLPPTWELYQDSSMAQLVSPCFPLCDSIIYSSYAATRMGLQMMYKSYHLYYSTYMPQILQSLSISLQ